MSLYANIIYEDNDIFVVNKSSGVEVDTVAIKNNNIISIVSKNYNHISTSDIFLVHRLDKYTSGIVVIAKNQNCQKIMEGQFKNQRVHKVYHAIVNGAIYNDNGIIDKAIGIDKREPNKRKILSLKHGGQKSITEYKVLKKTTKNSLVLLKPKTGRTHQLRVHCAYIGHSIIGDRIYSSNAKEYNMKSFALISKSVSFKHPKTNKIMKFNVDYNQEFLQMLKRLDLS